MYSNFYLKLIWGFSSPNQSYQVNVFKVTIFLVPKSVFYNNPSTAAEQEHTKRECFTKKRLTEEEIYFIWLTQTHCWGVCPPSLILYCKCIRRVISNGLNNQEDWLVSMFMWVCGDTLATLQTHPKGSSVYLLVLSSHALISTELYLCWVHRKHTLIHYSYVVSVCNCACGEWWMKRPKSVKDRGHRNGIRMREEEERQEKQKSKGGGRRHFWFLQLSSSNLISCLLSHSIPSAVDDAKFI